MVEGKDKSKKLQKADSLKKEPSDVKEPARAYGRRIFSGSIIFSALIGAVMGGIIVFLLVAYLLGANPLDLFKGGFKPFSKEAAIVTRRGKPVPYSPEATIAVAKKVEPSVVNIRVKKMIVGFFQEKQEESGVGSGVIFRKDGYILTNNHVVEGADEIFVTVGNEPDVKGKVVGRDPETDLAVVKVGKDNLPAAELGTSSDLKVGELAVAIGSPFGFEHTVTAGVISALIVTLPALMKWAMLLLILI